MPRSTTGQTLFWQIGWWSHISLLTAFLEMHIAHLQIKKFLQSSRSFNSSIQHTAAVAVPTVNPSKLRISRPPEQESTRQKTYTKLVVPPLTPYPHTAVKPSKFKISWSTEQATTMYKGHRNPPHPLTPYPCEIEACATRPIPVSPATNPFSDEYEVMSSTTPSGEDFILNDFYNQISPKRGFPYSRSPRLTAKLLRLVPPIDCEDVDYDYNSRYCRPATLSPTRVRALYGPMQRVLREEWLRGDDYSPEVNTALVCSRNEASAQSAIFTGQERYSSTSLYSSWGDLPSPVSSLQVASKTPYQFS